MPGHHCREGGYPNAPLCTRRIKRRREQKKHRPAGALALEFDCGQSSDPIVEGEREGEGEEAVKRIHLREATGLALLPGYECAVRAERCFYLVKANKKVFFVRMQNSAPRALERHFPFSALAACGASRKVNSQRFIALRSDPVLWRTISLLCLYPCRQWKRMLAAWCRVPLCPRRC